MPIHYFNCDVFKNLLLKNNIQIDFHFLTIVNERENTLQ